MIRQMRARAKRVGAVAAGGLLLVSLAACRQYSQWLGKAEPWSDAFPFDRHARAEVLVTGLEDVRGLAADPSGGVYLAEANGRVLVYQNDHPLIEPKPGFEDPAKVDQRGIAALNPDHVLLARYGLGKVVERRDAGDHELAGSGPLTGPSGVAIAPDGGVFVTDDRPWPGDPAAPTALDSTDYGRWVGKGMQRPFGSVYALKEGAFQAIGPRLRQPSGIAAVSKNGPVYVAESDSARIYWRVLQAPSWSDSTFLGSAALPAGSSAPPFVGMAVDDSAAYVFAAGPNSLYVFSRANGMAGRVFFEERVTGIASKGKYVYVIAGHHLCRLTMK